MLEVFLECFQGLQLWLLAKILRVSIILAATVPIDFIAPNSVFPIAAVAPRAAVAIAVVLSLFWLRLLLVVLLLVPRLIELFTSHFLPKGIQHQVHVLLVVLVSLIALTFILVLGFQVAIQSTLRYHLASYRHLLHLEHRLSFRL